MSTSKHRLSYLFDRYYAKTATARERDELFAIIAAGQNDAELSDLIRTAWDNLHLQQPVFAQNKTDKILNTILNAEPSGNNDHKNNIILWLRVASAAVVLVFAGVVMYFHFKHNQIADVNNHITKVTPVPKHDALPGGDRAILTLANGKVITLDDAHNGTVARQGNTIVTKTADGQLVYDMAKLDAASAVPSINTIATPRGGQYQVVLADGTKVWLNAASSLRFPTRFTGSSRNVEITGEAYFEVTKNPLMPFKVTTSRGEIEVLGTHFNVMDYNDEKLMKTTLLEGAVNLRSGNILSKLKPGEQAQVSAGGATKVVNDIDPEDAVAWKNGIFQFTDAGVDAILRQASRWYDVDVVYKGKIPQKQFTGSISRNVKASELLKMLRYTGLDVGIEGKNIIVN
jgi:transmembrane sensor